MPPRRMAAPKPTVPMNQLLPLHCYPPLYQKLAAACLSVHENAYAPYSNFWVGAALLHPDESITVGCNWENCVFQSVCAERAAIVAANSQGKRRASAVAVYGRSASADTPAPPADTLVTPCGVCRQMLNEIASLSTCDLDVVLVSVGKCKAKVVKLSTLLPDSFGPADIGLDLTKYANGNPKPSKRSRKS